MQGGWRRPRIAAAQGGWQRTRMTAVQGGWRRPRIAAVQGGWQRISRTARKGQDSPSAPAHKISCKPGLSGLSCPYLFSAIEDRCTMSRISTVSMFFQKRMLSTGRSSCRHGLPDLLYLPRSLQQGFLHLYDHLLHSRRLTSCRARAVDVIGEEDAVGSGGHIDEMLFLQVLIEAGILPLRVF